MRILIVLCLLLATACAAPARARVVSAPGDLLTAIERTPVVSSLVVPDSAFIGPPSHLARPTHHGIDGVALVVILVPALTLMVLFLAVPRPVPH